MKVSSSLRDRVLLLRVGVIGVAELVVCLGCLQAVAANDAPGSRPAAEVLSGGDNDLRNPENRQRLVREIKRAEDSRHAAAVMIAKRRGLPLRVERPDGQVRELMDFDGRQPVYFTTLNANAAISSGADRLRAAPYYMDGKDTTVGVWDAGSVSVTHQEFGGGRVTSMDGAPAADHSTHVGGTIGAAGIDTNAQGMAPAVHIDSYDWNNAASEMSARGASYPGEPGTLNLSNHSYGMGQGWVKTGVASWEWYGSGTDASAIEDDFGKYNAYAQDADVLACSMPYDLMFWAAGNDRLDNPKTGDSVALSPGGEGVAYDPALHPPGDNVYSGGYDTMGFDVLAKNVLSIGAVKDAVTNGLRETSLALMFTLPSWGPADDGRIKPDVVANGYYLTSPVASSDTAYKSLVGTSMANASAAGTAQQLVHGFGTLFSNQFMRASTLKALLLHTADDRGNAGPDYVYGWGLINGKGAADLLLAYRTNPGTRRVIEDRVATNRLSVSYPFTWDGVSPIRATLCWTDPAGAATATGDSRTPCLVNDLDLAVRGPAGTVHLPWVMPFVGNWSTNAFALPAVTGTNSTDNVEQVLVAAPPVAGVYRVDVTFKGTLANGSQSFSLILGGMADSDVAPAPQLTSSSPWFGTGTLPFTLTGDRFQLGAEVRLRRINQPDVVGSNVEVLGDTVNARFNTAGMASGWWRMTLTNPDGKQAVLWNAFAVPSLFWSEDFETNNLLAKGWSFLSGVGTSQWALTTSRSVSPTRSVFSPGVATRSDTSLVSPAFVIASGATGLRLTFWHDYTFTAHDAGVLEFSLDGGAWFDANASGSGASFAANGYTGTVDGSGPPDTLNPLNGQAAWIGTSGGFTQVAVALTDDAKYAGHSLRVRWRLGTDSNMASTGWFVDDVVLSGIEAPPRVPLEGTKMRVF